MGKLKQIRTKIEERLMIIYSELEMTETPANHEDVVKYVLNEIIDIFSTSNVDIDKAFDKWLKKKKLVKLSFNLIGIQLLLPDSKITTIEKIWSEIRNNYEEDGVIFIDAWENENDDSDGNVIAKIDATTGKVEYKDLRAITDKHAQEIIHETVKGIVS